MFHTKCSEIFKGNNREILDCSKELAECGDICQGSKSLCRDYI